MIRPCDIDTAAERLQHNEPWLVELVNVDVTTPDTPHNRPCGAVRVSWSPDDDDGLACVRSGVVRDAWLLDTGNRRRWHDPTDKRMSPERALRSLRRKRDRGWRHLSDVSPPFGFGDWLRSVPSSAWLPGEQIPDLAAQHEWKLVSSRKGWRVYRDRFWDWWSVRNDGGMLRVARVVPPTTR